MENISRVLKVFVIAGGVALLGGSVLLVVLILTRPSADPAAPPESAARAENPEGAGGAPAPHLCELALPAPGTAMGVPLPAGARIQQVVPSGGCLILLGVDGAGSQFVALVDPYTGARLSLLLMRPEP